MINKFCKTPLIILLSLVYLYPNIATARFAEMDEAPAEFEISNNTITVNANGSYEQIIEEQILIINERGREDFSKRVFTYNSATSKIEILEAKTILDGKEEIVKKEHIETKPLASSLSGFDQQYQVMVAYPKAVLGARLYIKYKYTSTQSVIPNNYFDKYVYGLNTKVKNSKTTIKSKIPFEILITDPGNHLDIKQSENKPYQILEVTLKKPIYTALTNEPNYNIIEDDLVTFVEVSTAKDFKTIADYLSPFYEKIINQPLPKTFDIIVSEASKLTDEIDQINKVTSEVANRIRYTWDMRTVKGFLIPRNLDIIASSGFGDCKDYTALNAAILRKIGFKATPSLVFRGTGYYPTMKYLSSLNVINHIMLKVVGKSGKIYWIDPTNYTSMAGKLYPDISNRPTLVLDIANPIYENIPEIDCQNSNYAIVQTNSLKENIISAAGNIKTTGDFANYLTEMALTNSPSYLEEQIASMISGEATPLKKQINLPKNFSRIVKDLDFSYSYEIDNNNVNTNLGSGFKIRSNWPGLYTSIPKDQAGIAFISAPYSINKKLIISNLIADNLDNLNFELNTPWIKIKRQCQQTGEDVVVTEQIEILKRHLLPAEAKSPEFLELINKLKKHYIDSVILPRMINLAAPQKAA